MQPIDVFLDLDGVFADFYGFTSTVLDKPYKEMNPADAWAVLDKIPNLFQNLPMLDDGRKLWSYLRVLERHGAVRLQILSALPWPTNALSTAPDDKRCWVYWALSPDIPVVLAESGPAKALYARPGAILIDDLQRNIDAWNAARGTGILHVSSETTITTLLTILSYATLYIGACMPSNEKYAAKSQSGIPNGPGTVLAHTATATESAISSLNEAVAEAHRMIEALITTAEPHLPRYLFDSPSAETEAKAEARRVSDYSESASTVLNCINSATNEIDRLTNRIDFLRQRIVT
jgi:hypothetical protein